MEDRQAGEEEAGEEEEEEDTTACEVCSQSDREDRLLLCDGCDLAYHCECLNPPLADVPVEEWFCPTCAEINGQASASEAAEEEADADAVMGLPRRQIARTRVSERVRHRIQVNRLRRYPMELVSSEDESGTSAAPSTSGARQSSTTRRTPRKSSPRKKTRKRRRTVKRKTTKKRKTPKKKTSTSKTTKAKTTGAKGKKRKVRRRKKKRRVTKKKKPAAGLLSRPNLSITSQAFSIPVSKTIKGRIAQRLGLSKPPPGRTIPLQRRPTDRPTDLRRGDTSFTSLSIMGDRDELIAFQDVEEDTVSHSSLPAAKSANTVALSRRPIVMRQPGVKKPIPASRIAAGVPAAAANSFDLLGSIFHDQSVLHMNSSHVVINRDGSLKATKPVKAPNMAKPPSPVPHASRIADLIAAEAARSGDGANTPESKDEGENGDKPSGESTVNAATTGSFSNTADDASNHGEINAPTSNNATTSDNAATGACYSGTEGGGGMDTGAEGNVIEVSKSEAVNRTNVDGKEQNKTKGVSSSEKRESETDSSHVQETPETAAESDKEEGELDSQSQSQSPTPAEEAAQNAANQELIGGDASVAAETTFKRSDQAKNRYPSSDDGQKMVKDYPFSVGSLLSHLSSSCTEDDGCASASDHQDSNTEIQCLRGTYVRVNKDQVDVDDLDCRLELLGQQRRQEMRLMRMYGLEQDDAEIEQHHDQDEENEMNDSQVLESQDTGRDRTESDEVRGREDCRQLLGSQDEGRDRNEQEPDEGRGKEDSRQIPGSQDEGKDQNERESEEGRGKEDRRRSRSRSRDRDRNKRRRSRSRERRRSRSRSRERRRSRSRERSKRQRDDETGPDRDRGKKVRTESSTDRFGREMRSERTTDQFGREIRSDRATDQFGREMRRSDRDSQDDSERDRYRDQGRESSRRRRSRSPPRRGRDWDDSREREQQRNTGNNGDRFGRGGGWKRQNQDSDFQGPGRFARGGGRGRGGRGGGYGSGRPGQWKTERFDAGHVESNFGSGQGYQGWPGEGQGNNSYSQDQYPQGSQQQQQYQNPQNMYSQPPPMLPVDPYMGTQMPPGANSFQPWMTSGFQPSIPPPSQLQQPPPPFPPPPPQQQPPPVSQQQLQRLPPVTVADVSQPPPPLNTSDLQDAIKKSLAFLVGGSNSSSPFQNSPGLNSQQPSTVSSYSSGTMQGYMHGTGQVTSEAGDGAASFSGHSVEGVQQAANSGGGDGMEEDIVQEGRKSKQSNDFENRVVEEVKQAIRPFYSSRQITKDEYKEILKKCVPKVTSSGEINPKKITHLVAAYVKKFQASRAK